jgi:hypothetical protein
VIDGLSPPISLGRCIARGKPSTGLEVSPIYSRVECVPLFSNSIYGPRLEKRSLLSLDPLSGDRIIGVIVEAVYRTCTENAESCFLHMIGRGMPLLPINASFYVLRLNKERARL